jgi:hypothetical protein
LSALIDSGVGTGVGTISAASGQAALVLQDAAKRGELQVFDRLIRRRRLEEQQLKIWAARKKGMEFDDAALELFVC